jgi:hypothetical protein
MKVKCKKNRQKFLYQSEEVNIRFCYNFFAPKKSNVIGEMANNVKV